MKIFNAIRFWVRDESGQSMVEYGMLIALVATVLIASVGGLGKKLLDVFKAAATF